MIVHLGDMVDRGFDSRRVLDHLITHANDGPPRVLLLGNHDLWLREFVAAERIDLEQAVSWIRFGGDATLLSYGIKVDPRVPELERFDAARLELRGQVPGGACAPSWTGSTSHSASATTSSAMRAFGPRCRWSSRARRTCCGSASHF